MRSLASCGKGRPLSVDRPVSAAKAVIPNPRKKRRERRPGMIFEENRFGLYCWSSFGIALDRPNENKMSDGGRGRASLGVKVLKSSQKSGAQRSAVRSIAWLDVRVAYRVIFARNHCNSQRSRTALTTASYISGRANADAAAASSKSSLSDLICCAIWLKAA